MTNAHPLYTTGSSPRSLADATPELDSLAQVFLPVARQTGISHGKIPHLTKGVTIYFKKRPGE